MSGSGDPVTLEQLERLARSHPRSGREAQVKVSAIRTLERLARDGRQPVFRPSPPDWHPMPHTASEELDRADLEGHPEMRQRWWEAWCRGR